LEELVGMFAKGAGVGAWIFGFALVIAITIPVVGFILMMIGRVLKIGRKGDDL